GLPSAVTQLRKPALDRTNFPPLFLVSYHWSDHFPSINCPILGPFRSSCCRHCPITLSNQRASLCGGLYLGGMAASEKGAQWQQSVVQLRHSAAPTRILRHDPHIPIYAHPRWC